MKVKKNMMQFLSPVNSAFGLHVKIWCNLHDAEDPGSFQHGARLVDVERRE